MQLRYRTYLFPENGVTISRSFATKESEQGVPFGEDHVWNVSGNLFGDGQADLIAQQNALMTALGKPYGDLVFLADGGTTAFQLNNAASVSGVRITNLTFPGNEAGDFATRLAFSFTATASYQYGPGVIPNLIIEFSETLSISGGGPRYDVIECINALPIRWQVTPASVCRVVQQGSLKSLVPNPEPPGPIFPEFLLVAPDVVKGPTSRSGQGYWEHAVSWTYQFAAPGRLDGVPNR